MHFGKLKTVVTNFYERERIPDNCYVEEMPALPVPEALGDEFRSWCPAQAVVIGAPTGSGKSTYVAQILRAAQRCSAPRNVLYLCHRSAISLQQKMTLCKKAESQWRKVNDIHAFELTTDFPDIGLTVMTYQRFARSCRDMDLSVFRWVIFDEAHFFYSDALFNAELDKLLWALPELLKKACRIYLTATPARVLPLICEAERGNLKSCAVCRGCRSRGCVSYYHFPESFEHVELHYFRTTDEIVKRIQDCPDEKFLIFTSAREPSEGACGNAYRDALNDANICFDYLDSGQKSSDEWNELCHNECFSSQVLLSTSVIDCGVNIHDERLTSVVLDCLDKSSFIQMLGRKRLKGNEHLRVFVRAPTKKQLYARLHNIEHLLRMSKVNCRKEPDNVLFRAWSDESRERPYLHLFNYEGNGRVSLKRTAYYFLCVQQATIEKLLAGYSIYGDDSAYPRLVHEWLNDCDGYDEQNWLDHDEKMRECETGDLIEFLHAKEMTPMLSNQFADFARQLQKMIAPLCCEPHDGERDLGYRALNSRLAKIGIPYQIERNKKSFLIQSVDLKGGESNGAE